MTFPVKFSITKNLSHCKEKVCVVESLLPEV